MNKNRYAYQLGDDEEEEQQRDPKKKPAADTVEYEFDGYEVEINQKVALMPKTDAKL